MTFCDFQGHLRIASFYRCDFFLYSCAAVDKMSTDIARSIVSQLFIIILIKTRLLMSLTLGIVMCGEGHIWRHRDMVNFVKPFVVYHGGLTMHSSISVQYRHCASYNSVAR